MPRPGIMIYFDMLGPIRVLSDADKGRLLVAMLEYGQTGKVPAFDGMLALAWEFVRPKLDKDGDAYEDSKAQRQYAAFCKQRTSRGLQKISFEEWLAMDAEERKQRAKGYNEPQRAVDFDNDRYPSTTTTTATATTTTPATAAAASTTDFATVSDDELSTDFSTPEELAAAVAERKLKLFKGELGKGVVLLSDAQIADLLDKLDLDAFDHYVDKLATFIVDKGAHVKNHYDTILKWWRQDSGLEGNL